MTAQPESDASPENSPPPARTHRRPRDMVISLVVLLLPIALIFVGWRFISSDEPVSGIDAAPSYAEAESVGLAVRQPGDLESDWAAVSHNVSQDDEAVTLRVGYTSPDGSGVQLVQSDQDEAQVVADELGEKPRSEDDVEVDGVAWQRYTTIEGNTAIITSDDGLTVLLHGDGDVAELRTLAESLE